MIVDIFNRTCAPARTKLDYFIILSIVFSVACANIMGDECDWTGSGLTSSSSTREVTPVYLRCQAGHVTWLYPRGALRVLLRLPAGDRDFRACIKVRGDTGRVRLFLEGPRSLLALYRDGEGTKGIRCFHSKNGQAAIYVETTEVDSINRREVDIEYDLEPLPKGGKGYDPTEDCRPCTGEELAHAFCTSDLVTRGRIRSVENTPDASHSQMSVKITKLIRHTTDDGYSDDLLSSNLVSSNSNLIEDITRGVELQVPAHCGVAHGSGEFVFMARRKLGDLALQCAPRLEDWAMLVRKLMDEGKAHCVLKS